jgi:hypothetical protein
MPRVNQESPGLMPGIDLEDFSAIRDMEDRDYVRRMRKLK